MAGFGEYFKQLRLKRGLSLRRFSEANGFDAGNISRLERGVFPPPESETKLREYARALGLKPCTDEWIEFFDRAAASRGQIPRDLQKDENLVKHLPVLFRTLRGRKVSPEALDKLVELIRTSLSNGR
jgi:transcriptional regulator with XRE-family HTH domain